MKKFILGMLVGVILVLACCVWSQIGHETITISTPGSNKETVLEYVNGKLKSRSEVTYVVSTGDEAN